MATALSDSRRPQSLTHRVPFDESFGLNLCTRAKLVGQGAPALAYGHRYSHPGLERWELWSLGVRLLGYHLQTTGCHGQPDCPT